MILKNDFGFKCRNCPCRVYETGYYQVRCLCFDKFVSPLVFKENDFIKVPVGFAKFPKELPTPPRSYIEKGFNIQHWAELPAGGHFAALEQPELLSKV
jgi:hypothetical protein